MPRHVMLNRFGLSIDNQPVFLLAGQIHYFRYPKAEWRDLLLTAKAGGLNTIDTVIPWNLHEPIQGQYNFIEEADLEAFLDLCHELGLWAIVRPGPYICAEWENGGFPAWFTTLPNIALRLDNPVFLEHTLRWFDRLFTLLVPRQIQHGGAIILCQIENEHWASGRYGHDMHQHTLANAAIERGITVPQYTCMGATPGYAEFRNGWSGIAEKLVATRALWPDNPMIVSELWSGWFDQWGASRHAHKTADRFDTILAQLSAVGASGWSHWMWAGGTNFDFWGGRTVGGDSVHMTTSYDYDAPVNEYNQPTPKFYVARRHHLFAHTLGARLAPILADAIPGGPKVISPAAVAGRGEAGAAPYRNVRAGTNAPQPWQTFTATFLHNTLPEGLAHHVYLADGTHLVIEVEANTIKPIFTNMPLRDNGALLLAYHTSRILGFWPGDKVDTLVVYGFQGEVGALNVRGTNLSAQRLRVANAEIHVQNDALLVRYWISDKPTVLQLDVDGHRLQIVLLTTERAARWWPLADGSFAIGPDLVLDRQQPTTDDAQSGVHPLYTLAADGTLYSRSQSLLHLTWTRHDVAERTSNDDWEALAAPRALEELGAPYGYGWYRTTLHVDNDTPLSLVAPWLNDRARVLIDGNDHGWLGVHPHGPRMALELPLETGTHDLRLLVDNLGRFNYGSNTGERKGLLDNLYHGVQHDITGGWTALWQEAMFAGEAIANAKPWAVRADAEHVQLDSFAFQGPSVWLLRSFEGRADRRYVLHVTGDRSSGALFVNGESIARFSRHYGGGFIKADISAMIRQGTNVLALHIQNYAGAAYRAFLLEYDPQKTVGTQWYFRAGVTPNQHETQAIQQQNPLRPQFYRARFTYNAQDNGHGPFRFFPGVLHKGQLWLNGRGLGRYWQIGPQEAYKIPVSWLDAENELLVFEESGGDVDEACIG